jgi:hypothetical protein
MKKPSKTQCVALVLAVGTVASFFHPVAGELLKQNAELACTGILTLWAIVDGVKGKKKGGA